MVSALSQSHRERVSETQLKRIGKTMLYAPSSQETFVFLLWVEPIDGAPDEILLSKTWADISTPQYVGYYVFLLERPADNYAAELEAELRQNLAEPSATGFGWAAFMPPDTPFDFLGGVAIVQDLAKQPTTAADTPIKLPPRFPEFGFAGRLSVISTGNSNGFDGLALTTPRPVEGTPALGIAVPLLGSAAGCICFSALLESPVKGEQSIKPLANVILDPLRPFDPKRTHITPTGPEYVFSEDVGGAFHINPYRPPVES